MSYPANLLYTKDHEWIRIEGDVAYVGITAFAQGELGDIVYVDIQTAGASLKEHEVFGTIEAVKTVSDLYMPVEGTILEVNPLLSDKPELVNQDPYGDGWMVKVKVTGSTSRLLNAEAYTSSIGH